MIWQPAQAVRLSDGRLHLHHGPIDLIVEIVGEGVEDAYRSAQTQFAGILENLTNELPQLRARLDPGREFSDPIARRMQQAIRPFVGEFVTPMAAVAGAVADEILATICRHSHKLSKVIVNNGGDIALYLGLDEYSSIAGLGMRIDLVGQGQRLGVATSGWRGRSLSLGIADAVTIVADTAACADAAATMIANRVNIDDDTRISRVPANSIAPDSDLGEQRVTRSVPPLDHDECQRALDRGSRYAQCWLERGIIEAASISLQGETVILQSPSRQLTIRSSTG